MTNLLKLHRIGSTPWGTLGHLTLPDGSVFPTLEPRWEYNAARTSCIPAGDYALNLRTSPIIYRTSGQLFHKGWEIDGVLGRDLIMIHPGNWQSNTQGCVLVGRAHAVIAGKPGVSASRAAFKDLMARLDTDQEYRIEIKWTTPE